MIKANIMREKMKKLRSFKKVQKYEQKLYTSDCNTEELRSILRTRLNNQHKRKPREERRL